jgi:hypothetical protein
MQTESLRLSRQMLLVELQNIMAHRVIKGLQVQLRDLLRELVVEYLDVYPF